MQTTTPTSTRTPCSCRGATARTTGRRDPDCTLHGIDADQLAGYHATTYTIHVEVIWPDPDGRRRQVVTTDAIGCHTRADCWPDHAPGVSAREAAEKLAAPEGLYVGKATMGHVLLDGQVAAGWHVYLTTEPPAERAPEPPRPLCRQCGDRSGFCRHAGGRYGR